MLSEKNTEVDEPTSPLQSFSNNLKKMISDIKEDTGYFTKTKRQEVENILNKLMNSSSTMNHLLVIIYKLLCQSAASSRNEIFDLILWAIDYRITTKIERYQSMSITDIKESLMDIKFFESIILLQDSIDPKDFEVIKFCSVCYIIKFRAYLCISVPKEAMLQLKKDQEKLFTMLSMLGIRDLDLRINDPDDFGFDMKKMISDIKEDTGYFTKTKRQEVENILNKLMNTSSTMNHLVTIIHKLLCQSAASSRNDIFDLILWEIDSMFTRKDDDTDYQFDKFESMSIRKIIKSQSCNTSLEEIISQQSVFNITEKDSGSSNDFRSAENIPNTTFFSKLTIGYTIEDIRAYRRNLQECIDDKTLKCIKSFEFYNDNDDKPHISLSIIDPSEEAHLDSEVEDDKKKVKDMLSEFGLAEEDILIDYELSSGDFQPAMESELDDTPTDEEQTPGDCKSADEGIVNVAASNLGDTGIICNLGFGSTGTCTRGLVIKLKLDKFKGLEKIIPDLDTTREIYANVGASHTVPRVVCLKQSFLSRIGIGADLIAHELNVAGQSFNVRNKDIHLYNDLEIFVIRNKTKSGSQIEFETLNIFDETFTHWKGCTKHLDGNITHVWSGDVNNKVLNIDDEVYFLGKDNKSYGTVTAFPIKYVGEDAHYTIKCQLRVQKGDLGGVLFKSILDNNNKKEFIAVGICSYFVPVIGENYGDISYFVPLTDLDDSIYELPPPICELPPPICELPPPICELPPPICELPPPICELPPPITVTNPYLGNKIEYIHEYRRNLQKCIDDKTFEFIESFEFFFENDGKPHISFSIIDLSEEVEDDKTKVKDMLSEFGLAEDDILINYELSSGDFQPAMESQDCKSADEGIVNVAASKLGDTGICNLGFGSTGTCTRGLVIKLKLDKFKGLEKIIPNLDITKEIYANVGASHTVPRTMSLRQQSLLSCFGIGADLIAHELNVAGQSFNVRNSKIHRYNDLEIFVFQNKTKSGSPIKFKALNTFKESFYDLEGVKKDLEGCITQVWSGDVKKNKVLKIGDTVYFIGQHNKSVGTVSYLTSKPVGGVEHFMIKCELKIQRGDSGGLLFKHIPASCDNDYKDKFIAVGICSYFTGIKGKLYGVESYFVPLTDLDESIYELPLLPPSTPTAL